MLVKDVIIKPEKITLQDGREGFFFQEKINAGSTVIVRSYKRSKAESKNPSNIKSKVGQSLIDSLKEVKKRKVTKNYPTESFDQLMDEL